MSIILPGGKRIGSRKRCIRCKRIRLLKKFCRSTAGYYASYCDDCHTKRQAAWAKKHPKQFGVIQQRHLAKLRKLGVKRIRDLKKKKDGVRPPENHIDQKLVPKPWCNMENGNENKRR